MIQRHTPLQLWERAAFDRYARQNGFRPSQTGAFWHTYAALLHGASPVKARARLHGSRAATRQLHRAALLSPSVKIENRLFSLFAE